jgi:prevent-host-death family protein
LTFWPDLIKILARRRLVMRHVALSEAKDHLSEFVAAAEAGQEITITRHGKPAARLVAVHAQPERKAYARAAIDSLLEHRAKMRAEGRTTTIEELIAWKNDGQR